MATVRMSDGLKNVMFRRLMSATPPKQMEDIPQQITDDAYALWLTTDLGKAISEITATYPKDVLDRMFKKTNSVRISSINHVNLWGRYTSDKPIYVPKDNGYSEFNISVYSETPEALRIVAEIERIHAENKARGEENARVEREMRAMLDSAPTLNGVLKKYPFLRDITPPEALDTLKKKVVRQKKEVTEPELSEEASAILRRIKIGLVAQKVSGE